MTPLVVAHVVFWVVLVIGAADLGRRAVAAFVLLWLAGYLGTWFVPSSGLLFVSCVAVLDVILVLAVFKGDVKLQ